jgi:hypothetical protein
VLLSVIGVFIDRLATSQGIVLGAIPTAIVAIPILFAAIRLDAKVRRHKQYEKGSGRNAPPPQPAKELKKKRVEHRKFGIIYYTYEPIEEGSGGDAKAK